MWDRYLKNPPPQAWVVQRSVSKPHAAAPRSRRREICRRCPAVNFGGRPGAGFAAKAVGPRTLPGSLLGWLEERLKVTPYLDAEQQLEVPVSALGGFVFEGKPPAGDRPLVRLRVLTPGWKRRGATLVRPTVEWLTD